MSPFQVWFDGWWIHHTGTRVRQLASFTMHTGLARQSHTYLLKFPAFPTCYFSLSVSTPGRLGVLEVLLSPSPALRRNFICTDTAHSPILANLYLDKLDKFVETVLIPAYTKGTKRKANKAYEKLMHRATYLSKTGRREEAQVVRRQAQKLSSQVLDDPDYRRLRFCRYADDVRHLTH